MRERGREGESERDKTNHSNVYANFCEFWRKGYFGKRHVLYGRRVKLEEAKVVDIVSVDGAELDFLLAVEHRLCKNGT